MKAAGRGIMRGERAVERGQKRVDPEEREWRGRKDEKRKDEMREVEREREN